MELEITEQQGVRIIKIPVSYLESRNVEEFYNAILDEVYQENATGYCIDLQNVTSMDSHGLSTFLKVARLMGAKERFCLINVCDSIQRMFTMTHVDQVVNIVSGPQQAMEYLQEG